jgi:hypothetical protein
VVVGWIPPTTGETLLKPVHTPGKIKPDPHNYRDIGLGDVLGMIYQMGLRDTVTTYTLAHDLSLQLRGPSRLTVNL